MLELKPIKVTQLEIGFKSQYKGFTTFVTPFFSRISNLLNQVYTQDTGSAYWYYTPPVYSIQQTIGIEYEGIFDITSHFNIRSAATLQHTKSVVSRTWDVRQPGKGDDTIIEKRNGVIGFTPNFTATITPSYKVGKLNTFLSWRYVGKRAGNALETFYMPAYSQFDLGIAYQFTSHLSANVNVNNLFNGTGITGWYAPGGFPNNLLTDGFTPEKRQQNPNAIWGARFIQPRSYYLTIGYNF